MAPGHLRVLTSNLALTAKNAALTLLFALLPVSDGQTASQTSQATSATKPGAVVLGRVTEGVRGPGVPEATVRLSRRQGGEMVAVIADAQGQFVFFNVPDGAYDLTASKPGFWFGTYGQTDARDRGQDFVVSGARAPAPIAVPVWRGGEVSGMITDETGAPAPGWTVQLMAGFARGGRLRWVAQSQQAVTDDRGAYRLGSILPATYLLLFKPPRTVIESNGGRLVYPTLVYPSARSLAAAAPLRVELGRASPGMNASVQPLEAFQVTGQVLGASGAPVTLRLSVWDEDAGELEVGVVNSTRSGDFTFDGVPAGIYRVSAWTPGAARSSFAAVDGAGNTLPQPTTPLRSPDAFARVVVSNEGVPSVVLTLPAQATVTGRVVFRGETQPSAQMIRGVVIVASSPDGSAFGSVVPDPAGAFSTAVIPGSYFVRPVSSLTGWMIDSISASGKSALDSPIAIEGTGADVVITFTDRLSEVSGTVRAADGGPLPADREASVLVFPVDRALWLDNGANPLRMRTIRVTSDGAFVARGLIPGEYFAVASTTADAGPNWQLATTLERLSRSASRFRVSATDKAALELRLWTGR